MAPKVYRGAPASNAARPSNEQGDVPNGTGSCRAERSRARVQEYRGGPGRQVTLVGRLELSQTWRHCSRSQSYFQRTKPGVTDSDSVAPPARERGQDSVATPAGERGHGRCWSRRSAPRCERRKSHHGTGLVAEKKGSALRHACSRGKRQERCLLSLQRYRPESFRERAWPIPLYLRRQGEVGAGADGRGGTSKSPRLAAPSALPPLNTQRPSHTATEPLFRCRLSLPKWRRHPHSRELWPKRPGRRAGPRPSAATSSALRVRAALPTSRPRLIARDSQCRRRGS